MLSKIFEALYFKVLVNIVVKRASTVVYIETLSKKRSISTIHSEFDTKECNKKMQAFINEHIKESPYYYISLLDRATVQGAIPTCEKHKRLYYYSDLNDTKYKCYNRKWTYYTSKSELYKIEKIYKEIGLDFIFSPFVLLNEFFQDKIDEGKLALYVLIEETYISLAVFENTQLLYAEHLDIEAASEFDDILLSNDIQEDLELGLEEEGIDLENMDVEDDDDEIELEDFGDIEDLDSLEDIDEFDDSKDVEEELLESEDVLEESNEDRFNEDYQRFSLIQTSVAHYYKDERYESKFLENIYIADGIGVSSDLKKYLEEEMFFNVYIRRVELDAEICELTKRELDL